MNDLERARYITANYGALKGLKLVPFGLFMMLVAARDFGLALLGGAGDCTLLIPGFLVMLGFYFLADRYYARHFGTVQPKQASSGWMTGILLLSLFFGAVALDVVVQQPISLVGLLIGVLLIYEGRKTRRVYYWIAGVVILLLSLAPLLLPLSQPGSFQPFGAWWNMIFGLTWIILGILDHIVLMRSVKPVEDGVYARAE